jgi:hypothetical protein
VALIRESDRTIGGRRVGFHELPLSEERCSRDADSEVCGVPLCWQHRRAVTCWDDGVEQLRKRADDVFATWRVSRSAPFVPQL